MSEKKQKHCDEPNAVQMEHFVRATASFSKAKSPDEASVLSIRGSLDSESAMAFYESTSRILSALTSGTRLELRLDEVVSIASVGVGALTRLFAEAAGRDITMYIASMSPACSDVFSVLGLSSYVSLPGSDRSSTEP